MSNSMFLRHVVYRGAQLLILKEFKLFAVLLLQELKVIYTQLL